MSGRVLLFQPSVDDDVTLVAFKSFLLINGAFVPKRQVSQSSHMLRDCVHTPVVVTDGNHVVTFHNSAH